MRNQLIKYEAAEFHPWVESLKLDVTHGGDGLWTESLYLMQMAGSHRVSRIESGGRRRDAPTQAYEGPFGVLSVFVCLMATQVVAQESGNGPTTAQEIWRHLPPLPGLKSETASAPALSGSADTQAGIGSMQSEATSASVPETNALERISASRRSTRRRECEIPAPLIREMRLFLRGNGAVGDISVAACCLCSRRSATDQRDQTIEWLAAEGWTPEEAVTPITVGKTHVRYFHPQDRAAAQDLAQR